MSSLIGRAAFRAAPRLRAPAVPRRWTSTAAAEDRQASKKAIAAGAKRDPELYVCSRRSPGAEGGIGN